MKKQNASDTLNEMIAVLQQQQALELEILKDQFHITYESLKPVNLIKNTIKEVVTLPNLKNNLLNNVIGLTTGFLSKKLIVGATHNPVIKLAGTLLQFAIANVVARNSESIKSTGDVLLHRIFKKKKNYYNDEYSETGNA